MSAHIENHESAGWLIDFLDARNRDFNWGLHADFFRQKLAAALVLLDGLNEAPRLARPMRTHCGRQSALPFCGHHEAGRGARRRTVWMGFHTIIHCRDLAADAIA